MRAPFESAWAGWGFLALTAVALALPAIWPARWLPPKAESYAAMPEGNPMDYLAGQLYREDGPLDVVFLGSSRMWLDVNAETVNRYFDERMSRPAQVRTLGWLHSGLDQVYFILRDLLARRAVGMVVLYGEWDQNPAYRPEPQTFLYRSSRWPEVRAALTGLPWQVQLAVYGASVYGMPRTLLSLAGPARPLDFDSPHAWSVEKLFGTPDPRAHQGSLIGGHSRAHAKFEHWTPAQRPGPQQVYVYGEQTRAHFRFRTEISSYQKSFALKIRALAAEHGTRVVMLHLPYQGQRTGSLIEEPARWPEIFGEESALLGMAPDDFWKGLTEEETERLVTDIAHLNANGQALFTEAICPALWSLYDHP